MWCRLFKFIFITCAEGYPKCCEGYPNYGGSYPNLSLSHVVETIQGKASAVVALLQMRWCFLEDRKVGWPNCQIFIYRPPCWMRK